MGGPSHDAALRLTPGVEGGGTRPPTIYLSGRRAGSVGRPRPPRSPSTPLPFATRGRRHDGSLDVFVKFGFHQKTGDGIADHRRYYHLTTADAVQTAVAVDLPHQTGKVLLALPASRAARDRPEDRASRR